MIPEIWLYGRVGEGRRARILEMTLQARAASELPQQSGVLLVTGEDFCAEENHQVLLDWIEEPSRLLLVVPPLQIGVEKIPLHWSVQYREASPEGGAELASFLRGEIQYHLHGDLRTDHLGNMQFSGQTLAVGYYRPRIVTGILAITVLPLWSVRTVDKPQLVQDWIRRIFALAGKPRETNKEVVQKAVPTRLHFSILLYLCSQHYETLETALDSLDSSPVFQISREQGRRLCYDLGQWGYIAEASLTDRGEEALRSSPFGIYVDALRRIADE